MATSTSSEDMIFVLDTSSSMYRSDNTEQSRLIRSLQAINKIIEKKIKIDPKDRYGAITFARTVNHMQDMVFSAPEVVDFIQKKEQFEHETFLGEALSVAVQMILKEMRFIGQKLSRLVIISDGIAQVSKVNPINIAKVAMQLGIMIDVIRFGPAQIPGNILKKLTDMTHGDYYYVSSAPELEVAVDKLSKKKEKKHSTIFDKKDDTQDIMIQEIMAEIADIPLKLEYMTEDQKDQAIYKLEQGKKLVCTICFSDRCMVDKTGFYGCGRFCPNCLTPYHLHCAIMWSEQNAKKGDKPIPKNATKLFRCVHCFYLLKIPNSDIERTGNENLDDSNRILKKVETKSIQMEPQICNHEECGILINPKEDLIIYQCTACESYFHADCARNGWQKEKKCPYCHKYVSFESME